MTVAVNIETVAGSIAALSISGVTIKDYDNIPDNAVGLCPVMLPQPNGYITDIAPSFESFGSNGSARMNLAYTLNYVFLHSEIGSGINAYAAFGDLMTKLAGIFVAIMSNDAISGAVDVRLQSVGNVGVVTDPAGNEYWGILFSLRVLEYVQ